jgi:precorrin-6A synthase
MFELLLIGIGTGNPDHLTGQGRRAIAEADLILIPRKGETKSDLADLRRQIVDHVRVDGQNVVAEFDLPTRDPALPYLEAVNRWHDAIATIWAQTISQANPSAQRVALLVWGDPSLYDSTLRIAERLRPKPVVRVIPGITSLQALTAAHAIPLNTLAAPVLITTGRRLREQGWPPGTDTAVVMLDGDCAFQILEGSEFEIWWGAFLGMPDQILCAGPLDVVCDQIIDMRDTGRKTHGWIMDTYLLRRRDC